MNKKTGGNIMERKIEMTWSEDLSDKEAINASCPACHHYNALLLTYKNGRDVFVCRDCGYEMEVPV
jgi:Zn ribbon nucleic-acid-binding protein